MSTTTQRATMDDLMQVDGKAELIGGKVVMLMPTGRRPSRVAAKIYRSLDDHAEATGVGEAYTDNIGYGVPMTPSGREALCPDASYFTGPFPADTMRYIVGPPTFAVEVRSESDYGDAPEAAMAVKRTDYFAAGTLVVWDVDPVADTIDCYRASDPDSPVRFQRGQTADAEPAVPGWRVQVDVVFNV